jgi:hypothetical protein
VTGCVACQGADCRKLCNELTGTVARNVGRDVEGNVETLVDDFPREFPKRLSSSPCISIFIFVPSLDFFCQSSA